jgi:probable HAF family extracellular repeat protein
MEGGLGTLPGGNYSQGFWISNSGLIAGDADNGVIDPITGLLESRAVVWNSGQITNLGTLGGNWSWTSAVNDAGVVAGCTTNTTSDPYSWNGVGTQTRAFQWKNGAMKDLGTLGGPDACAGYENDSGQISGVSCTNATPSPLTGIPTVDPFLWNNGKMLDLGSLGGDYAEVTGMNNLGQVIGTSYGRGSRGTSVPVRRP